MNSTGENAPQQPKRVHLFFGLTLLLATTLFGSVVYVLVSWGDVDAVLYAALGAAVGWCAGMLVAPYKEETERFAAFAKTLSVFLSGYLVSKLDSVWGILISPEHRSVLFDSVVQRRAGVCVTCFFLVGAAVFKSRSYMPRQKD